MCTDVTQHDSISALQEILSKSPNVLLDQIISDEEIDEDAVQYISSFDDLSTMFGNYTGSSKQIENTNIESVGHNSAEVVNTVKDIGLVTYRILLT